jgi:hypothetical protein
MRTLCRSFAAGLFLAASLVTAQAGALSQERQAYLEGVWNGVAADTDADKLCTLQAPAGSVTLSIEFMRSGGAAFADDGSGKATRGLITEAADENGIVSLTFGKEVWRLRADGPKVMYRVRSSATAGGGGDLMVFKRCKGAADRTAIALDDEALKLLAADLPGDEAFFMDERLVAKGGDRCAVEETQYLFFVLIGPSEFRLSRWNSFALADKLAAKQEVKLPPLDPVANWKIENARAEGKKYVFLLRDYDNAEALPETIHLQVKPDGTVEIPEWRRTYVRCKKFQSRS